jgi:hypothetical protein
MAMNWDMLRSHYLQGSEETQVNSLVLNLLRIQALASSGTDKLVALHLVRESQCFIEWIVPRINLERDMTFATDLLDLQRILSGWKLDWSSLWDDDTNRLEMAQLAQQWCGRLQGRYALEAS